MEHAVDVAVDDLAGHLGDEPEAEHQHEQQAQRHAQDHHAPEQHLHDGGSQCVGQKGDHAVDAVFQRQAQRLVQQRDLRPHVGEQHLEDDQVQHRGHPQRHAHVDALAQHIEAEIHKKNLQRDHHAVEDARRDAGLEVALEGLAVGHPPVAGFVAQGAQHGVVHAGKGRPGQDAARHRADEHDRQAVCQKADVHQADHRGKAQAGEQVRQEHAVHIAADQLKKAAYAGLAGGVLLDALALFEVICGRKQTHFMRYLSLDP